MRLETKRYSCLNRRWLALFYILLDSMGKHHKTFKTNRQNKRAAIDTLGLPIELYRQKALFKAELPP